MTQIDVLHHGALRSKMRFNRSSVHGFMAAVGETNSYDELQNICSALSHKLGFLYAAYIGCSFTSDINNKISISNYPRIWTKLYTEKELDKCDPILYLTRYSTLPLLWDECHGFGKSHDDFMGLACEHQTRSKGIAIPVRGYSGDKGLLSFIGFSNDRKWEARRDNLVGDLIYFAQIYHCAVVRVNSSTKFTNLYLTTREKEVLTWASRGKTAWETGQILGLSERTVAFYIGNLLKKFNATSKSQVIATCIGRNLI